MSKNEKIVAWSVGSLVFSILTFVCVDCSAGKSRTLECYVAGKEYVPPRTSVYTSTDSDGNIQVHTTHYPEEFHVICQEYGAEIIDVQTSRGTYYHVTNGQSVSVSIREGRWTHSKYLPSIAGN